MEGQIQTRVPISSRIPVVNNCCFAVPLKIGALIITIWMLIWNFYAGIALIIVPGSGVWLALKAIGVIYMLVAIVSFYGAYSIYKELPKEVARFTQYFTWSVIAYFVIQIIVIIIEEIEIRAAYNEAINVCRNAQSQLPSQEQTCESIGFVDSYLASWIATFLIGVAIQAYLIIVIRSYNIELQARNGNNVNGEKAEFQTVDMNTYGVEHA